MFICGCLAHICGIVVHPIDICLGSTGKLLLVDVGKDDSHGTLIEVRLHYPADVKVRAKQISSPSSVIYLDGVAYVVEKVAEIASSTLILTRKLN